METPLRIHKFDQYIRFYCRLLQENLASLDKIPEGETITSAVFDHGMRKFQVPLNTGSLDHRHTFSTSRGTLVVAQPIIFTKWRFYYLGQNNYFPSGLILLHSPMCFHNLLQRKDLAYPDLQPAFFHLLY